MDSRPEDRKPRRVPCPWCDGGTRKVPVLRFLMHPEVPREAWQYPEPREGWDTQELECCVCRGMGWLKPYQPVHQARRPVVLSMVRHQPVKEDGEACELCGSELDVKLVQERGRGGVKFTGPILPRCGLCRTLTRGQWKWPRMRRAHLRVVHGEQP